MNNIVSIVINSQDDIEVVSPNSTAYKIGNTPNTYVLGVIGGMEVELSMYSLSRIRSIRCNKDSYDGEVIDLNEMTETIIAHNANMYKIKFNAPDLGIAYVHVEGSMRSTHQISVSMPDNCIFNSSSNLSPLPPCHVYKLTYEALPGTLVKLRFDDCVRNRHLLPVIKDEQGNFIIHDVDYENYITYDTEDITVTFTMPESDVTLELKSYEQEKENTKMEPKNKPNGVIDVFTIPEEIAKRLSELLVTQSIREKMLDQNIENPTKYAQMEKLLIPITTEIDVLKNRITAGYVPEQYRSDAYVWNFDGYEIDGCTVSIMKA